MHLLALTAGAERWPVFKVEGGKKPPPALRVAPSAQ